MAVAKSGTLDAYPEFNHQLQALLARMDRDDREAIGGSLRRAGFRIDKTKHRPAVRTGPKLMSGNRRNSNVDLNFWIASPIYEGSRQTGPYRIPHLRITRVSKLVVPRSAEGKTHSRYPERRVAGKHVEYVCGGAKASLSEHIDYILRRDAIDADPETWLVDLVDAETDRRLENRLAVVSNIPGGLERQRSLFEAAERCERSAHGGKLIASTKDVGAWVQAAARPGAPAWVETAANSLLTERKKPDRGTAAGRPFRHKDVALCSVSLAEAYDRLTWCDAVPELAEALPRWKAGPCGRVATRFVAELPANSTAYERHAILSAFGDALAEEGWMFVGAIHQPDPHNHRFNYHLHIDAYDRPSRWLEEHACWDFEYAVKKRNGEMSFPYRQLKIATAARDPNGGAHFRYGKHYFEEKRATFIDIVNGVMGKRVYVPGTYADNYVELRPLEHLGNKVVAREKAGLRTDAGSTNARIMFDDILRTILRAAEDKIGQLGTDRANRLLQEPNQAPRITAAFNKLEAAVTRRARDSMVEVVRRMACSRARTVLKHSDDPVLKEAAAEHLGLVARLVPTDAEIAGSAARSERLKSDAHDLLAAATRSERCRKRGLLVLYRGETVECGSAAGRFSHMQAGRLASWVRTHGRDTAKLAFADGSVRLGETTPKAILTLFTKVGANPEVQLALAETKHAQRSAAPPQETKLGELALAAPGPHTPLIERIVETKSAIASPPDITAAAIVPALSNETRRSLADAQDSQLKQSGATTEDAARLDRLAATSGAGQAGSQLEAPSDTTARTLEPTQEQGKTNSASADCRADEQREVIPCATPAPEPVSAHDVLRAERLRREGLAKKAPVLEIGPAQPPQPKANWFQARGAAAREKFGHAFAFAASMVSRLARSERAPEPTPLSAGIALPKGDGVERVNRNGDSPEQSYDVALARFDEAQSAIPDSAREVFEWLAFLRMAYRENRARVRRNGPVWEFAADDAVVLSFMTSLASRPAATRALDALVSDTLPSPGWLQANAQRQDPDHISEQSKQAAASIAWAIKRFSVDFRNSRCRKELKRGLVKGIDIALLQRVANVLEKDELTICVRTPPRQLGTFEIAAQSNDALAALRELSGTRAGRDLLRGLASDMTLGDYVPCPSWAQVRVSNQDWEAELRFDAKAGDLPASAMPVTSVGRTLTAAIERTRHRSVGHATAPQQKTTEMGFDVLSAAAKGRGGPEL